MWAWGLEEKEKEDSGEDLGAGCVSHTQGFILQESRCPGVDSPAIPQGKCRYTCFTIADTEALRGILTGSGFLVRHRETQFQTQACLAVRPWS